MHEIKNIVERQNGPQSETAREQQNVETHPLLTVLARHLRKYPTR